MKNFGTIGAGDGCKGIMGSGSDFVGLMIGSDGCKGIMTGGVFGTMGMDCKGVIFPNAKGIMGSD